MSPTLKPKHGKPWARTGRSSERRLGALSTRMNVLAAEQDKLARARASLGEKIRAFNERMDAVLGGRQKKLGKKGKKFDFDSFALRSPPDSAFHTTYNALQQAVAEDVAAKRRMADISSEIKSLEKESREARTQSLYQKR